jgi:DNA-binding beta-propeller fold protein YncE
VNAGLISGLDALGIAVSGSDLFVGDELTDTIGEYTTSGATVNAALISGLNGPTGIALSGSDLFVTNAAIGTIGEYTTSGATVNAALITGLGVGGPQGIAISSPSVPEASTWVMSLTGFAALAFAAFRRARSRVVSA